MLNAQYHRCLRALIDSLNAPFLAANDCFLSGATPIVLSLGEYRLADGLSLTCFTQDGYRHVREAVSQASLGPIFGQTIELAGPVRADRFGVRAYVMVESTPIHFELLKEGRFGRANLAGSLGAVPTLSRSDLFVERLLANADQYGSSTTINVPVVDLAMMVADWGAIPEEAWERAQRAYGPSVTQAYAAAVMMLRDADKRSRCVRDTSLEPAAVRTLLEVLPKLLVI
jgi:hypothetical protein